MKKLAKLLVTVLSAAMLVSSFTFGTVMAEEAAGDFIADVQYMEGGKKGAHLCDIYGVDGTVKPVILEVHGGGFVSGSKETNAAHSAYWADNGFIVVDINYTLMPKGDNKIEMQEFYGALHFIADNAETYGFDLNNLFISGDSAGGAHVQMIAANYANPELAALNEVTVPENIVMRAVVISAAGVTSFKKSAEAVKNGEAKGAAASLKKIYEQDDLVALYELDDWINENYPPCILLGAPGDKLCGEAILVLNDYLTEKGIEHELVYVQDQEHELMHVFNVTYPDWIESIEANSAAVEFMRNHMQ